mgnify:CR=1 FL=1
MDGSAPSVPLVLLRALLAHGRTHVAIALQVSALLLETDLHSGRDAELLEYRVKRSRAQLLSNLS